LKAVLFDECPLYRVQGAARSGQALDSDDGSIAGRRSESEAPKHALTAHEHGARAALALIATFFGASKLQMLAQGVE
jgi:hypothetical protein